MKATKTRIVMNIKKMMISLLVFFSFSLIAQQGPIVPCINCDQLSVRTEPVRGLWYNPEQSGSGYSIEVQNGKLFGAYYGYDSQGKPFWWTFLGDLIPSDNPEVMWIVESEMMRFENGNCINCDYQSPEGSDSEYSVIFEFKQKNYASVTFNDGSAQNIVPLVFGTSATADFPEQTSYRLPELGGTWSFVIDINEEVIPNRPWQWGYSSIALTLSNKVITQDSSKNTMVNYGVAHFFGSSEILSIGRIKCNLQENNQILEPSCIFSDTYGISPIGATDFHFSLGGLGSSKLFGETVDGHTFEASRVDYTEFGEIPE